MSTFNKLPNWIKWSKVKGKYIKTIEDYHDLIKQKFPELSKKML